VVTIGAATILHGDCLEVLATLPAESVHCCVTSPPYWGLRDYGVPGQFGLEPTVGEYIAKLVDIFREVRRVLRHDAVLWLNLGDCLKDKQLQGVPWRVAFALQDDGWWLRSDIIWAKPNPMPESVRDRPTKAHEYVFLLAKSPTYYFDAAAVREPHSRSWWNEIPSRPGNPDRKDGGGRQGCNETAGRNIRSVWTIATSPYADAHFATFPPELARRCILAGCPIDGVVLDPFAGAATTLLVADRLQRRSIGIELNPAYVAMAVERTRQDAPLFAMAAK